MLTAAQCLKKYGPPEAEAAMAAWVVPTDIGRAITALPRKIYCNRALAAPLEQALRNLVARGLAGELKTWDGCFNIRKKKAGTTPSLHSWGVAIDVNAAWNGFNKPPTLSAGFVKCFNDAGFDWGGAWKTQDGMHFQLRSI